MITIGQAFDLAESLLQSADEAARLARQFPHDKRQAQAAKDIAQMAKSAKALYVATRKYTDHWHNKD